MNITKARIIKRSETILSPWTKLITKDVEFSPGTPAEVYHCFVPPDYITIIAETPGKLIPIVRQFRPAVEEYTWELPAGLLKEGESPVQGCIRELKEETGLDALTVTYLGQYYPDTGRLGNVLHLCHIETTDPDPDFVPETGMDMKCISMDELKRLIISGTFKHQLHIAALTLLELHRTRE